MHLEIGRLWRRAYKSTISPILHAWVGPGWGCRFEPSCGEYCAQALEHHGIGYGSFLAVKRVLRCQPFIAPGWDPIPFPKKVRS